MAYDAPTPAELKLRYPELSAVDDAVVQYWLTDSERTVDQSWFEGDYKRGLIMLAAHGMASNGIGASGATSGLPEGVTNIRSGSFSMSISDKAASQSVEGGYGSTKYGRQFVMLLRQNKGGPRVTAGGCLPAYDQFNGYAGPLPPWVL